MHMYSFGTDRIATHTGPVLMRGLGWVGLLHTYVRSWVRLADWSGVYDYGCCSWQIGWSDPSQDDLQNLSTKPILL
jgi:hypothetical protein